MKSIISRYVMVPAVLLALALSGCGSGGGQGTASTASSAAALLTAQDIATAKAIENAVASLDANDAALAKVTPPAPPVAGEQKVFGKHIFMVPSTGTLSVSKTFAGLADGAQGTLVFSNSFGRDIPTTPCAGTARQIKVCEASRARALAWNPSSVQVLLKGQTVIAPNQIPLTQGKALIPVTVNLADTLQVNLSGPAFSFIQLEVWSQPTAPVALNPTANFTFTPPSGAIYQTFVFDASGSSSPNGAITGYSWAFGDGTVATGLSNPTHFYYFSGTYTVTLTVTDSVGKTATTSSQIVVRNPVIPVASFTYTLNSAAGARIFSGDASASSSGNAAIVSYTWFWGDGTPNTIATVPTISHTFAGAGTYAVTMQVLDAAGYSSAQTQTIVVP